MNQNEKELLLKRINFFLQGIDNMSKQSLINEHTYIKNQFQSLKGKIKWTPGARHSKFSNIYATEEQNVWASDPGYSFDEPGTSNLSTHWQPGARHPNYPHVYAGNSKQTWLPDPGYTSSYDNDLNPKWTSGATHPKQKHLHASAIEGMGSASSAETGITSEKRETIAKKKHNTLFFKHRFAMISLLSF